MTGGIVCIESVKGVMVSMRTICSELSASGETMSSSLYCTCYVQPLSIQHGRHGLRNIGETRCEAGGNRFFETYLVRAKIKSLQRPTTR